ncbi:hypothetical protein PMAYCL1PPCAC_25412, partial [Pristionchus mayeri]
GDRCVARFGYGDLAHQGCSLNLPQHDLLDGCYGPEDYRLCFCKSKDMCNEESLLNATLNKDKQITCFDKSPNKCSGASCHIAARPEESPVYPKYFRVQTYTTT